MENIPNYCYSYINNNGNLIVITKNGGKRRLCSDYFKTIENNIDIKCGKCPGCYQSIILPQSKYYITSTDNPDNPIYAITEFKIEFKLDFDLNNIIDKND
jgi:hypothetical protein